MSRRADDTWDYKVTLDPACDGADDRRCVWEVHDTDDQGRRDRTIAVFSTLEAAEEWMGERSSGYLHRRQIRVYETAAEVQAAHVAAARSAALKKLTPVERELLGISA